jgi:predicted DNA-binding transcriptional regulator AlpA
MKGKQDMLRNAKLSHHLKESKRLPRRATRAKPPQAEVESTTSTLLKDQQVMTLLGISRTGLHYLMRKQGLPYIKLGEGSRAALRFNEHSLQLWLKQHEQQAIS